MRPHLLCAVLLLGACTKKSLIPCKDQPTCAPYNAVCLPDGFCHNPVEEMLDLSGQADLSSPPPDLTPMCTVNGDCTAANLPICDPTAHVCRACSAGDCGSNPGGALCATTGANAGACVACLDESDCAATSGYCSASGKCADCFYGYQCKSGVCGQGCVAEADVVYVDNTKTCAAADGTRAKPYCKITDAITALGTKKSINVAGSATAYPGFSLSAGSAATIRISGPGVNATPPATIGPLGSSNSLIIGVGAGTPTALTFEGVQLVGQNSSIGEYLIIWAGSSTLDLRNSIVKGTVASLMLVSAGNVSLVHTELAAAGDPAINVSTGTSSFSMKGCYLHDTTEGVWLSDGGYTIESNLFSHNSRNAIHLTTPGTGVFQFNTVVGNGYGIADNAVTCTGTRTLSNSIVVGNPAIAGTQISQCTLDHVITGSDTHAGATQLTPTFVSTTDYHLVKNDVANLACCIDKAVSGPTIDADAHPRPLGAGYDIGAYEVQ